MFNINLDFREAYVTSPGRRSGLTSFLFKTGLEAINTRKNCNVAFVSRNRIHIDTFMFLYEDHKDFYTFHRDRIASRYNSSEMKFYDLHTILAKDGYYKSMHSDVVIFDDTVDLGCYTGMYENLDALLHTFYQREVKLVFGINGQVKSFREPPSWKFEFKL